MSAILGCPLGIHNKIQTCFDQVWILLFWRHMPAVDVSNIVYNCSNMRQLLFCQTADFYIFPLIQPKHTVGRYGKELCQTNEHVNGRLDIVVFPI